MRITLFSTLLLAYNLAFAASGITYHGRILKPDGTPVVSATTEFHIQIRSPGTESCLMWEEYQTKDLSATAGAFSVTIGDIDETNRTQTNILNPNTGGSFSLPQVFSNRAPYTSGLNCVDLSGTYTPGNLDGRAFKISFRETNALPWEDLPLAYINYVPLAYNSSQLDGYRASEFLKIDPLAVYTPLSAGQVNTLVDIIAGTNTQYLRPATTFGGDVSGTYNAISVDRIRGTNVVATAPTVNQVLKFDGTNWVPSADDTGGAPGDASYAAKGIVQINTDQATSGLYIASGVLALPNVITAGGPVGSATTVPVITYDQKGRLTTVSTATINDTTKLPLGGGTMTGPINMGTQNITNATSIAATNFSGRNLVLNDDDTNTATIRAPTDITTNYNLTLPVGVPQNGYVLSTDAAGQLSWIAASSGSMTSVSSTNAYLTVDSSAPATPTLTVNVGTAVNTVAAGNDARIVGALQAADYNAQVLPAASCTTAQTSYYNSVGGVWACQNIAVANFSGNLAGDVTGTQGATVVERIRGTNVVVTAPTLNQVLKFDGTNWVPSPDAGLTAETDPGVQTWAKQAPNAVFTTAGNELGLSTRIPVSAAAPIAGQDGQTLRWNNTSGLWEWFTPGVAGSGFTQGGNSFGANAVLGTNDNFALQFETNGSPRMTILNDGKVGIGTAAPTRPFEVVVPNGEYNVAKFKGSSWNDVQIILETTDGGGKPSISFDKPGDAKFQVFLDSSSDNLFFNQSGNFNSPSTDSIVFTQGGFVGIRNQAPTTALDINGAITQRGMAAPGLSPAGQGRIYFSTAENKFKVSQNGGAYVDMIGSGGVTGSGTTNFIPKWSSATGLTDSIIEEDGTDLLIDGMTVGHGPNADNLSVAVGSNALISATTGYANVGVGSGALSSLSTNYENVGVGLGAAAGIASNFNTALGTYAIGGGSSGPGNTAVGARALNVGGGHTGAGNTVVGAWSANNLTTGSNNIIIGNSIDAPSATGDYQLNIGDLILGSTAAASRMVDINGSVNIRGLASAPSQSAVDNGKIYFDSALNKFRVSENGGAYVDLVSSGGGGDIANGGNTFGAAATIGTNDNFGLNFETNGSNRLLIMNDGSVGIGSTAPDTDFHLKTSENWSSNFRITNTSNTGSSGIEFFNDSNVFQGSIGHFNSGNGSYADSVAFVANTDDFIFVTGDDYTAAGDTRMIITNAGDVGIGNGITPSSLLDIDGAFTQRGMAAPGLSPAGQGRIYFSTAENKFKVSQNGGAYTDLVSAGGGGDIANGGNTFGAAATIGTNDNFALNFETNGSPRMTVRNDGNVGIGETNPTTSLVVRQDVNAYNTLTLSNQHAPGWAVGSSIDFASPDGVGAFIRGSKFDAQNGDLQIGIARGGNLETAIQIDPYGTRPNVNIGIGPAVSEPPSWGQGRLNVNFPSGSTTDSDSLLVLSRSIDNPDTAVDGYGSRMVFTLETDEDGYFGNYAAIESVAEDVSRNSKDGSLRFYTLGPNAGNAVINPTEKLRISSDGFAGFGVTNPSSRIDIDGAVTQRGIASPAVSSAGQGRIYFSAAENKFKVSQDGGAYTDLVGGGISGLTTGRIPKAASATTLSDSIMTETTNQITVAGQIVAAGAPDQTSNSPNISFNNGNSLFVAANCTAFNLSNMASGGSYTFAVQGTSGTCSFTHGADTVHYAGGVANVPITAHTIFSFAKYGTHVYVTWVSF